MKQLIRDQKSTEYVYSNESTTNKFYGVKQNDHKGFITARQDEDNKTFFCVTSFSNLTMLVYWWEYESRTLKSLIDDLLNETRKYKQILVYEFDTWQELLKWAID